MADRERYIAESRAAHRAELKTAVLNYLEHAQQLQGELDVRERGQSPEDLKRLIEQLWLAEKGVEIICSDAPEIDWSLTRAVSTKWCVMLPTTRIGGRTVPTCSTR